MTVGWIFVARIETSLRVLVPRHELQHRNQSSRRVSLTYSYFPAIGLFGKLAWQKLPPPLLLLATPQRTCR